MPATITAVDAFHLRIPHDMWAEPPLFAGRPRTHVEAVYVRVTTDKGVVGWGECNGFSGAAAVAAVEIVSRVAFGQDPTDPELTPRIERLLHGLGRAGVDHARDQRPRHRVVGHPRQARRRLGVEAAWAGPSASASRPTRR